MCNQDFTPILKAIGPNDFLSIRGEDRRKVNTFVFANDRRVGPACRRRTFQAERAAQRATRFYH